MNLDRIKQELLQFEGLCLKPYFCPAGKLTIGVGRNLEEVGITKDEALQLLSNDLQRCQRELENELPWTRHLPQEAQEVLLHMTFNLGLRGLMGFKNALSALEHGNYRLAAQEMLNSKWAGQVGQRAQLLARRMELVADQPMEIKTLLQDLAAQLGRIEQSFSQQGQGRGAWKN